MTPEVVLALALAGVFGLGEDRPLISLLLLWIAVPLARIAAPHSNFYNANRHFLEYIPALSLLAGIGFSRLQSILPRFARVAAAVVLALALALPVACYQPFETTYFNAFVGGLGGAQRSSLLALPRPVRDAWADGTEGDYWANSAREAVDRLRELAPPNSRLALCGLFPPQVRADAPDDPFELVLLAESSFFRAPVDVDAPFVLAIPSGEPFCSWQTIRSLEHNRPILARVTRGGGLIYEIFGPPR
jgi:hypothetical protein